MSKPKLPARIEVGDYHEFDGVKEVLRAIGLKGVKAKEIGFNSLYIGIVYTGKLTDPKNAKMIAEIKKEEREFYADYD